MTQKKPAKAQVLSSTPIGDPNTHTILDTLDSDDNNNNVDADNDNENNTKQDSSTTDNSDYHIKQNNTKKQLETKDKENYDLRQLIDNNKNSEVCVLYQECLFFNEDYNECNKLHQELLQQQKDFSYRHTKLNQICNEIQERTKLEHQLKQIRHSSSIVSSTFRETILEKEINRLKQLIVNSKTISAHAKDKEEHIKEKINLIKENQQLRQAITQKNTTISNLRHQLKSQRIRNIKHTKWKEED